MENSLNLLEELVPDVKQIEKAIETLIKSQSHGTSIVFMDEELLKIEVSRLRDFKRAYEVHEFDITEAIEVLKGVTSMDGALLADLRGNCYAVGAILDGELLMTGNPGRGARYNSIVNYTHWVLKREREVGRLVKPICFAAVLSEDGMVNLEVPEFKSDY